MDDQDRLSLPEDNSTPESSDRTAEGRDRSSDRRDETSESSDRKAEDRDRSSEGRDRSAEVRDRSAEDRDRMAGDAEAAATRSEGSERRGEVAGRRQTDVGGAFDRAQAASDRIGAATDRADAASDREDASSARRRGALDRTQASDDRGAASVDREASAQDREDSSLDELTGAYRRGAGLLELEREMARAKRTRGAFTLAFVDVDGLKEINDSAGHDAGDQLLRDVVDALRAHSRSYDLVVRYGGDEFVCAFPDLGLNEATKRFEGVREDLERSHGSSITSGLTSLEDEDSLDSLIARADAALYDKRRSEPNNRSRR